MSKKRPISTVRHYKVSPRATITDVKRTSNWAELLAATRTYNSPSSLFHTIALGDIDPNCYSKIRIQPSLYLESEQDEARWAFCSLYINKDKLLLALGQEKIVEKQLISGNYIEAEKELIKLETMAGCSLTSLYYRLFLIERLQGRSAHKKYLSDLNEKASRNILFVIIADF